MSHNDLITKKNNQLIFQPKKGFMPTIGVLPDENAIKYSVCKFCIHQRLKVCYYV